MELGGHIVYMVSDEPARDIVQVINGLNPGMTIQNLVHANLGLNVSHRCFTLF